MKDKIRTAVVGLGMGQVHARGFTSSEDADLVAFVDTDQERLNQMQGTYSHVNGYTDFTQMLQEEKPDLVTLAIPNFLHAKFSIQALKAGCHVLCEKPMAMTVEECHQMEEAAIKNAKKLYLNLSQRFNKRSRGFKEVVDSGGLGDVYHGFTRWTRRDGIPGFGGWFGQKEKSGGGPLIDLGVHRLDLAMWLMGSPEPITVSGTTHQHIGIPKAQKEKRTFDVEDLATGFIRFSNGASLVFEISWDGFFRDRDTMEMRIVGTKGGIEERDIKGWYYTNAGRQSLTSELTPELKDHRESYAEAAHCLRNDIPFGATSQDGLRIQKILVALYKSAETGKEIDLRTLD